MLQHPTEVAPGEHDAARRDGGRVGSFIGSIRCPDLAHHLRLARDDEQDGLPGPPARAVRADPADAQSRDDPGTTKNYL